MSSLTFDEFNAWKSYIYDLTGIHLDEGKSYLVEHRLAPLLRETGLNSYSELLYLVKADPAGRLKLQIINAITTNETSFFRDNSPWELLQFKILPELIDQRSKITPPNQPIPIRIWSAACSTGQEPYTIGMTLKELLGPDLFRKFNVSILGTDISDQAVGQASRGYFSQLELDRGMPPEKIHCYFSPEGNQWKINDDIRSLTTFRHINLLSPFPFTHHFDIIFCRNVAIYFKQDDKAHLFNRLANALEPDGFLVIGSTESITGICPRFESKRYLRSLYYQLVGKPIPLSAPTTYTAPSFTPNTSPIQPAPKLATPLRPIMVVPPPPPTPIIPAIVQPATPLRPPVILPTPAVHPTPAPIPTLTTPPATLLHPQKSPITPSYSGKPNPFERLSSVKTVNPTNLPNHEASAAGGWLKPVTSKELNHD